MTDRAAAISLPSLATLSWAWAAVSFLGWAGAHVALLFPVSILAQVAGLPHPVMLGVFAAAGALAGGAVAVVSGWLLFPSHRHVPRSGVVLLGTGALVTGAFQLTLAAWAIERFGYFDRDFIGATAVLFAALSGTTVAGFGVYLAPAGARMPPFAAVVIGVALSLLIIASNVPGAADGIAPESLPLTAAMAAAGVLCVVTVGLVVRRAASGGDVPVEG